MPSLQRRSSIVANHAVEVDVHHQGFVTGLHHHYFAPRGEDWDMTFEGFPLDLLGPGGLTWELKGLLNK